MKHSLTQSDLDDLFALRHRLHRNPEISGREERTAQRIAETLKELGADQVETGIGGHGVVGVFSGAEEGPLVLLRAELDALPINETSGVEYASSHEGWGHLCGHDGHSATLIGVARVLSRSKLERGRVGLLFQPAEETGQGARAMLEDDRISKLNPAAIFSQHNLPGMPIGQVALRPGPVACASCGMKVVLTGRAAHASQPETGQSPRAALAEMLNAIDGLNTDVPLEHPEFAMSTVTHCAMGAPAFGTAPGSAEIWTTLRSLEDAKMAQLRSKSEAIATDIATLHKLDIEITYHDVFDATVNDEEAVRLLRGALDECGIEHSDIGQPWRPSEDFGRFAKLGPIAMMFTGAGKDHPPLHDPAYDFPDVLIEPATKVFLAAIEQVMVS